MTEARRRRRKNKKIRDKLNKKRKWWMGSKQRVAKHGDMHQGEFAYHEQGCEAQSDG